MGKPYQQELAQLVNTTREAFLIPIDRLKRAVEDSSAHGLVIVASGGSQSAAHYLAELHQEAVGHACRIVTPLVFQSSPAYAQRNVWLLSAGGRNPDILDAGRHAIVSNAHSVTALVAAEDTPLEQLLSAYGASRTISFTLSAGKDGFLASNSLWAYCLLLERAYRAVFGTQAPITQRDSEDVLTWARKAVDDLPEWTGDLVGIGDPYTMVGMADLEMRTTEAALANVWVTDLRNIGHGRHYWFATKKRATAALCLATGDYKALAEETARLIRDASPAWVINVPGAGSKARLGSIAFSMHLAQLLGTRIRRDPGQPGIPSFGEALYNLSIPTPRFATDLEQDEQVILAKLGRHAEKLGRGEYEYWKGHLNRFRAILASTQIPAVVFDFDGTLIESSRRYEPMDRTIVAELHRLLSAGVRIGIATGRGESCGAELRNQIPQELWGQVAIGYYNGALILPMGAIELPPIDIDPVILEVEHRIERDVLWPNRGRCRTYAKQCSVSLLDGRTLSEAWAQVSAALRDLVEEGHIRVWVSSHSIDVVSAGVTKQSVASFLASQANCLPEDLLCIGDRGRWPGNDSELLQMPLSLSADECSNTVDRCWNLAGIHRRQVSATCYQLSLFDAVGGMLRFRGG
ncbi:HAD hydrolase family protein [Pinirhizobacter soli]|uniref:HAD hydrolase family protein n=1 Tax=Pinirhizobacter soli TaxID=2786953 RepID=UPI00202A8172|nr:HAD hydrolase family protein [Pinirhizobacter soli]